MKTTSTLIPHIFAASIYAHGILYQITINGKSFLGNGVDGATPFPSVIRQVSTPNPIKGANNTALNCGPSLVNSLHPIHAVVRVLAFVRECVWARLPATILPRTSSPTPSHNAAGMLLSTQEDPFILLLDRWEGKVQSEPGSYLRERLWTDVGGVVGTLAQRFATTTVFRVRCASPFDAGVGRRRSRWGVLWRGRTRRLFRGRGEVVVDWEVWVRRLCQVF